jgi:hypothetical protein
MELAKLGGIDVNQLLTRKDHDGNYLYGKEKCSIALEELMTLDRKVYEYKIALQRRIIQDMKNEGATKFAYKSLDGTERIVSIKKGPIKAINRDVDNVYMQSGYDSNEIGHYEFKPELRKINEIKKFGGEKAELLKKLFIESEEKLEVK